MKAVLITGASSGIGLACARLCLARGWQVYGGVRTDEQGRALEAQLGAALVPLVLDLTRPETITTAAATLAEREAPLAGLVHNAGIAVAGPLETLPVDALRDQFEVTIFGAHTLTRCCLPRLRANHGRVIWLSSISGRVALPYRGPYAAAKFALEALADAWRLELAPETPVVLIEPGRVRTPIWDKTARSAAAWFARAPETTAARYAPVMRALERAAARPDRGGLEPDQVAGTVWRALTARRPRARYVLGRDSRILLALDRLPDRWRDAALRGLLTRDLRRD
ncbi:MAG: SDR family oxidoreductase [Candidatus Marinimicrobia bacterium]|nr:SDR family oxidoreductase [Candidatus Neomarinimicrobiota bacterium]